MACGAVAVVSKVASLPELLGDAAVFVKPGDTDELSAAIGQLLVDDDRRQGLAAAGIARAGSFSWTRAATETAAVYRSLGLAV
jgi:glycosyltransferase involved in cell wall biosynthesis